MPMTGVPVQRGGIGLSGAQEIDAGSRRPLKCRAGRIGRETRADAPRRL